MVPILLVIGIVVIIIGVALFRYGYNMDEDDKVATGIGTYTDRTGFMFHGSFVIGMGILALMLGIFITY